MLPKAQSNVFHKIKDEFIEWSYFQNEFKRKLNVEITSSKDNNNIFSYDNRTENSYKFLKSPAIVLLNSKDLADDFIMLVSRKVHIYLRIMQILKKV